MMSMIFNGFDSMERAREFVAAVQKRFGLDGQTFSSEDDAHEHDLFPWVQEPPVAHIDRPDRTKHSSEDRLATEYAVEELVSEFGGKYLGT